MQKLIVSFSLFFFVCFTTNKVYASVIVSDSIPAGKLWKIPQQQFLDQYGRDDTARAIIDFYFTNHSRSCKALNLFAPLAVIATAILVLSASSVAILVTPFFAAPVDIIIVGILEKLDKYSRKKLYKELQQYLSGKPISSSLKRNIYNKNLRLKSKQ